MKLLDGQSQVSALFGIHLLDIIDAHPELRIITADMSYIANLELFKSMHRDQFINMGISEQNMIGVASGISSEGYQCVCLAQACFITMRCFEQVRQYMSYMGLPIILIGLSAGFGLQFMGNTHYAIEDISLMRSIPGITIFSPADAIEAIKAFDTALELNRPCYIRLTGIGGELVYKNDFEYDYKKCHVLKEGDNIVILSTGSMVVHALDAAIELENRLSVSVSCVDCHCLVPLDVEFLNRIKDANLIVTVEEHSVNGGLGTAVSDYAGVNASFPPVLKLGIDGYSIVGDYPYLLEQHRLSVPKIIEDIVNKYNSLL